MLTLISMSMQHLLMSLLLKQFLRYTVKFALNDAGSTTMDDDGTAVIKRKTYETSINMCSYRCENHLFKRKKT